MSTVKLRSDVSELIPAVKPLLVCEDTRLVFTSETNFLRTDDNQCFCGTTGGNISMKTCLQICHNSWGEFRFLTENQTFHLWSCEVLSLINFRTCQEKLEAKRHSCAPRVWKVGVFVFHSWWWGFGDLRVIGSESFGLFFFFFFAEISGNLINKYSVHSSVTVTIETIYFFLLHSQRRHDEGVGGWVGGGRGWGCVVRWGGSLLVGSAPFRLLLVSVTSVQKAIKMLLKWAKLTLFVLSCFHLWESLRLNLILSNFKHVCCLFWAVDAAVSCPNQ